MRASILAAILWLAASAAHAQGAHFGDWKVQVLAGGTVASTTNDSGNEFGKICFTAQNLCFWTLFTTTATCREGQKTPVTANADSGARHFVLTCVVHNGDHYQVLNDPDAVDEISDRDPLISFAVPMVGDTFTVMRFSLKGSDKAVAAARASFQQVRQNSTSDLVL